MHPFSALRPVSVQLAKRELLRLPNKTRAVRCDAGSLWITQDNDPRDIVLAPGEGFTPDPAHPAIVYALDAAALTLSLEASVPAPAHRASRRPAARSLVLE